MVGPVTRLEGAAGGVGLVAVLWASGYHGAAVVVFLVAGLLWWVDAAFFDEEKCWCDNGKVRSPITRTWRKHRRCGGSGVRPRRSRRFMNRQEK